MKLIVKLMITIILVIKHASAEVFNDPLQQSDMPDQMTLQPKDNFTMTFQQFKFTHSKVYISRAEEDYRQFVFESNLRKVNRHNNNSSRIFNMKPNSFLDITRDEFKEIYTATRPSTNKSRATAQNILNKKGQNYHKENKDHPRTRLLQESVSNLTQPKSTGVKNGTKINNTIVTSSDISLDWTFYTGTVKNQGLCGSCYAFAAADSISALNAINLYSFFVPLSPQQIVDCADSSLTFGCNGGYLQGAYSYAQLHGITTNFNYPYSSDKTGKRNVCQMDGGPFKISSFSIMDGGDCNSIVKALAAGPISAGISANNLQFYETGIFNDCNSVLDHAILIVGYRSGKGWKIKNSWGTDWGQQGYAWIAENNTCGICNMAVEAIL